MADQSHVAVLQTEVGAGHTEEHHGQKQQTADDEQNRHFRQRLRHHSRGRGIHRSEIRIQQESEFFIFKIPTFQNHVDVENVLTPEAADSTAAERWAPDSGKRSS